MKRQLTLAMTSLAFLAAAGEAEAKDIAYKTDGVDARPAFSFQKRICDKLVRSGKPCPLVGFVFEDLNRDGVKQRFEPGIKDVMVSNGRDVVTTNGLGLYVLPIYDQDGGTTVFITKPATHELPVDEDNVPQFFYHHMPEGSPALRFGGLAPSGPLPGMINFPLVKGEYKENFKVVISGDTQPYSNNEIGYVRDTLARDVAAMGTDDIELVMIEGDIMGDDLGLFPRFKQVMSVTQSPLYLVGGNHDIDFDAETDAHSFDTYRREWGPSYYSFDIGKVHFVGLDDVKYPCTPDVDNADGLHSFCDDPVGSPRYNGRITDEQMEWLTNDLAHVPKDHLIVLNMHIPIVTYMDQYATAHQVDNSLELYEIIGDRPALALSGHTHTLEQHRPGNVYEGWNQAFSEPLGGVPFPQIVTGATCGSWWSGDFTTEGIPNSLQRLGAPRGHLILEFNGNTYTDRFKASNEDPERQMSLSVLSPTFRNWYDTLVAWMHDENRSSITPVSINDLPDPSIITPEDMAGGAYIVANVWNGSTDSQVWVQFDGGEAFKMTQSQSATGEGFVEALDPFALERQLYSLRYAIQSTSGDARAQGFELFTGAHYEGAPQPLDESRWTTKSTHLWTAPVPTGLQEGAHTAKVTTIDMHGNQFAEVIAIEVLPERPFPFFRSEVFE